MTDDDPRVQAATRAWNRTARQSGRGSLTNPTAIAAVLAAADAVDPLRQAPTVRTPGTTEVDDDLLHEMHTWEREGRMLGSAYFRDLVRRLPEPLA